MSATKKLWHLLLIILVAAVPRIMAISHGISFHPDERFIIFTIQKMSLTDMNPHFFGYGGIIFYALWVLKAFVGSDFVSLSYAARSLAVLAGLVTVFCTYLLGKRIGGERVGLVAAALLALNPLHIQLSHFYAPDIFLTLLAVLLLLQCSALVEKQAAIRFYLLGTIFGLAVSLKISALWLIAPLFVTLSFLPSIWFPNLLAMGAASGFAYVISSPFNLLDTPNFIAGIKEHIGLATGNFIPPFMVQYLGTTPYLYHLYQMWHFTLTPMVAAFSAIGAIWFLLKQLRDPAKLEVIMLSLVLVYFLAVGGAMAKFPRYMLLLYPSIFIMAAYFLKQHRIIFTIYVLFLSLFPAFNKFDVYRNPHIYEVASTWIYDHIPAGTKFVSVHWDDVLPIPMDKGLPDQYPRVEFPVYQPDTPEKFNKLIKDLDEADYIILPTNRTYESVKHAPENYPYTNRFFDFLFSDQLPYRKLAEFQFGDYDPREDESLSVYDRPRVLLYRHVRDGSVPR